MPRNCTVCANPKVGKINAALFNPHLSLRWIAKRYGVHESSVYRHYKTCLASLVDRQKELRQMLDANDLTEELSALQDETWGVLKRSKVNGDDRLTLAAIHEGRSNVEAFSRIGPLSDIQSQLDDIKAQLEGGRDATEADANADE
jgi:hypothetical protein